MIGRVVGPAYDFGLVGTTVTCEQLMPPDYSCTGASDGGCTCTPLSGGGYESENGTYTTSGSTLTTSGRTTDSYEYCAGQATP